MTLREQIELRKKQWESFNEWELQEPPILRSPASILADLGTIWSWLPHEVRILDPDPEKDGIGKMQEAFAILK